MGNDNRKHISGPVKSIVLVMSFALTMGLGAQDVGLSVGVGGATLKMDDLKYYQEYMLEGFPVEGRMISNYPSYLTYTINAFKHVNDYLRMGIEYNLLSSGARSNYSDYSGSIDAYQVSKSNQLGAAVNYTLFGNERFQFQGFGSLSGSYTILELSQYIYVASNYFGTVYDEYQIKYRSISAILAAGLEGIVHLSSFSLGIDGGYYQDFSGELTSVDDSNVKLADPNDNDRILRSDWSGFRVRIKMIIYLKK